MLISRVPEEGAEGPPTPRDHSHEYQTAKELFDLMATNHPFDSDGESLSTADLVILYKNIDLGTKLMSDAEELRLKRPNQHVESIVYNDEVDSEGSDVSEIYGTDDVSNVYSINNERLDLFSSRPSLENTLCQKLGDLEIQASNLPLVYDQHFLFKDPYIKEQLRHLNRVDGNDSGMALPASLLDYICCKRLEDNYNFYMDNIIRYVKHTIEQLKRISNGDYLTDRAKEKWREVERDSKGDDENTKVLATSTSIPLQVKRKLNGHSTMWDDIIHSEVDIRSLSKILEKKIIVEVPKLICGSYKLFSKLCSDNLIISCKRDEEPEPAEAKNEPRVDVVLQLERSESGQVMSNISSMIIVQTTPPVQLDERPKPLSLPYYENEEVLSLTDNDQDLQNTTNENKEETAKIKKVRIVEILETNNDTDEDGSDINYHSNIEKVEYDTPDSLIDDGNYQDLKSNSALMESGDSSVALRDVLDTRAIPDILRKEAPYNFISPDDLSLSMHKLNMSALPEETGEDFTQNQVVKKKSNTKVRIKSPYENKSHIMEEKKRKKLLEIREKREKKKMACSENCKITKHRYGKGAIMPQPSSSVTKLSITNKSFYNSIYGQNMNIESKPIKVKINKSRRDLSINAPLENLGGEYESPNLTPEKNSLKYINRSYYLDEAVTEMMYTQLRQSDCSSSVREIFSASASAVSGEMSGKNKADQDEHDRLDEPADSVHDNFVSFDDKKESTLNKSLHKLDDQRRTESRTQMISSSRSVLNVVPANSPKDDEFNEDDGDLKRPVPTMECRKSIDKLYELMKKLGQIEQLEIKSSKSKQMININKIDAKVGQGSSTIQGSDSGTSLKHHLPSSNPSSFSFEKIHSPDDITNIKTTSNKKTDALTTVVPKVIISTKQQPIKVEVEKVRKERRKVSINPLSKLPDNPLKAISQLLHEFDSVQKTRQRPPSDSKPNRKPDTFDGRNAPRFGPAVKRRSRIDQDRENEIHNDKNIKNVILRDRKMRPNPAMEPIRIPHQQIPVEEKHFNRNVKDEKHTDRAVKEDRHVDRITKKKIADIIDEVKEAKGEAVRGPSKLNSRLNSLAQPKKSYVQAHSEEYQTKYGKNLMADRLQRLASVPPTLGPAASAKNKPRRANTEATSSVSVRPPPPAQPLERALRPRRSAGSSPEPPPRPRRTPDPPDAIKNKMVAVESYLKSHYGSAAPAAERGAATTRAPLVPHDLDFVSEPSSPTAEESTAIGSKLHRIIDSMINAKPAPLAALVESLEGSLPSHERGDASGADNFSREPSSVDSDYPADVFEDKNVETAVESFRDGRDEAARDATARNTKPHARGPKVSSTQLQHLEEALHGRVTVGTYQPRLRMKNLTLAPKRSMQRVLVVQSGDVSSVVLKSTMSKSLKLTTSPSDVAADLNTLPALENSRLSWNFRSNIPMQIATVGYAFPDFHAAYGGPTAAIKSLDNIFKLGISVSSTSTRGNKKSDKTSQCFKGSQSKHDAQEITVAPLNNQDATPLSKKKHVTFASVATEVPVFNNIQKTCGDCSNVLKDICPVETEKLQVAGETENVDCTSSLDMLVGLLNEIQKITSCHITDTVQVADERGCGEKLDVVRDHAALKDSLENIHSQELVSIGSLDKLRQLESSPSIYSLYLSDADKESIDEQICIPRLVASIQDLCKEIPSHVDKEVAADFPVREYTNTFTDAPSTFFPITITHSTNVSSSLIGVLSQPSNQTISLDEFQSACTDSIFNCNKKIIEIKECEPLQICETPNIERPKIETQLEIYNQMTAEHPVCTKVQKVQSEIKLFANRSKYNNSDFDPLIKIKRDILVTVYSVLVLTVFAALSFPEILYHA